MKFWITIKKLNEIKRAKKKNLNAKLERHMIGSRALPYEVSALIILIDCCGGILERERDL